MKAVLRPMIVVALKDLLQRSRDRSAYIMGLVGPLALVFVLNSTLGAVDETTAFGLGLVDNDGGEVAAGFTAVLSEIEGDGTIEVTTATDRAALELLVDDGDIGAGYIIESGFSDTVQSGGAGRILVVGDPAASITVDVAEAIATTFGNELDYVTIATGSVAASGASVDLDQLPAQALAVETPIALTAEETDGRGSDIASYFALSLSVFFVFFTVQFGVLSIIEEREAGTMARLLVSPVPDVSLLLGKMISSFVIGVVTMVVLAVATTLVVGAEWGDPVAAGALIVIGVLSGMALALLVSAVAKTAEQAGAYASIAALVLGLLGGTFFPVSQGPGLLNSISMISPHRWLLDGFRDVSYGAGLGDLGTNLAVLGGFIVVAGGLGLLLAGRRMIRL